MRKIRMGQFLQSIASDLKTEGISESDGANRPNILFLVSDFKSFKSTLQLVAI